MNERFRYITLSPDDRREMLLSMGRKSMADLRRHIPSSLVMQGALDLPPALSEWELEEHLRTLAAKNVDLYSVSSFLGGGMYEHHIPAVVEAIADRGEFLTAYTPYQPEMSQGLLQVLAEYQQHIGAIAGLPDANSSCYDGATAFADAIWMGCRYKERRAATVALSSAIWHQSREVVQTYFTGRDVEFLRIPLDSTTGLIDLRKLEESFEAHPPSVLAFQTPNCFGLLEDVQAIAGLCRRYDVVSVLHYHPFLSGLFTPPGELGVDVVCGDGQMLGIPLSSGGPSLGFLACRREFRNLMPGRLVGAVSDIQGNPAYALVHEEREQHIARENATSNLCSNQAHCALRATVYLSTLGNYGLRQIAETNALQAHYFAKVLTALPGVSLTYRSAFFNEFAITLPCTARALLAELKSAGVYGGLGCTPMDRPNALLVAVTETKSLLQLDTAGNAFRHALAAAGPN